MLCLTEQQEVAGEHDLPLCIASGQELLMGQLRVVAKGIVEHLVHSFQEAEVSLAIESTALLDQPLREWQGVLHEG